MIQLSIFLLIFANDVVSPHNNESITTNHRTMRKLLLLILTLFIANLAVMADRVSEAEALQKAKGKLFPFGWFHLLKALKWKHADHIEMMLIAVLPEWQRKGVNALFFYDLLPYFISGGYKWVETNVELENNTKVQSQWQFFNPKIHKRRRCFKKMI